MEIDISLRKSLERLAANWDLPIEQVALRLAEDEISNRVRSILKCRIYSLIHRSIFSSSRSQRADVGL